MQVFVRDNDIDQALRVLKKMMIRDGVFHEINMRSAYIKPSERRAREKTQAIRRQRKLLRKKLQRGGLLPKSNRSRGPSR
ncbi:30S ribosomal protein S21 [Rhizobium sp. 11515TR]|uniref:30S ribosomal protein S21 n=1 Tax=unclassified Rhizobium TaxID=2613769 RepID=UPI000BA85B74|nr:30S ribosomal protein S21 [Rhizobium sp. 11515TR]ASW08794.1 30S ribosomal protein S21 [Rhizobium sp. 11515TR]